MIRFFSAVALLALLLLPQGAVAAMATQAAPDNSAAAKTYVDGVANQALQTIKAAQGGQISNQDAKVKFRQILNNAFDIPTIARFTLGRYWRVATPAQQTEYTRLVQKVILEKYADQLLEFSGNKYTVDNARVINDTDIGVNMRGYPANGAPVTFGWRLRKAGTSFKVIDLSVEGISMSLTHRTEFASVIERNGGQVQSLIDALQSKESAHK